MKAELIVRGEDQAPLYPIIFNDSYDGIAELLCSLNLKGRKLQIVHP